MNLRHHSKALIERLATVTVMDVRNLSPLDAERVTRAYVDSLCRTFANSVGEIISENRRYSSLLLGTTDPALDIYEMLQEFVLGELDASIEAAERNAELPVLEAAE